MTDKHASSNSHGTFLRAIIFDLDDTLYPQIEFKRSGFKAVARQLEQEGAASYAQALKHLELILTRYGASYQFMFNALLADMGLSEQLLPGLVETFRADLPTITPYPGVIEMLNELSARCPLGLLTDGLGQIQRNKVAALGVAEYFDEIVYSDDFDTLKPDPVLYRHFEKRLGLSKDELVYIADNPNKDFYCAKKLGWRTVRVRTGEFAEQKVSPENDADTMVDSAVDWYRQSAMHLLTEEH